MRRLLVGVIVSALLTGVEGEALAGAQEEDGRLHAFTLVGWVRPAGSSSATLLGEIVDPARQDGLWLMPDSRIRFAALIDERPYEIASPAALRTDAPTHVALVASEPELTLFVNGREVASTAFVRPRRPLPLRVTERTFVDGRAYRRTLSAEEILELAGGPDAPTPPLEIVSIMPAPGARQVALDAHLEAVFSEPLDPASVSAASIRFLDWQGRAVAATIGYDSLRAAVAIAPAEPMQPTRSYTLYVGGAEAEARVLSTRGEPLAATVASTFVTVHEPTRVAAGESHSVVVDDAGQVWTWGNNNLGQLGRPGSAVLPGVVSTVPRIVAVAAGSQHTLALSTDGRIFAWGANSMGQLGVGVDGPDTQPEPIEVPGVTGAIAVSAGLTTSAALMADGTVWTWGAVRGLGGETLRPSPTPVPELTDVIAIAAGATHVLAVRGDGTLWAWGANVQGELGNGTQAASTSPLPVNGLSSVGGIAAGVFSSYAVDGASSLWAWGTAADGVTRQLIPTVVDGVASIRHVSAGQRRVIAASHDGSAWAWGAGLGSGWSPLIPSRVEVLAGVWQAAAGFTHQLTLTRDGVVWSWSGNSAGQVGDGTTDNHLSPVQISETGFAWKTGRPVVSHQSGTYSSSLQVTITSASPSAVIRYTQDGSDPSEASPIVAGGVTVSRNTLLKARAWTDGQPPSDVVEANLNFKPATPAMTPRGETYTAPLFVQVSTTPGAIIHYTTDGSEPTPFSTVYTGPLSIARTQTIKAIAARDGWTLSDAATEHYRLNLGTLAPPLVSPAAGSYEGEVAVTLSSVTGATIVFTTDGSIPTATSPPYTAPIVVSTSTVVRARAYHPDYGDSPATEALYRITAAMPTISPGTGVYGTPQAVRIASATPQALVRYTLDGSDPTELSPVFDLPLDVAESVVVRARAFHAMLEPSDVAAATLTFRALRPEVAPRQGVYGPQQRFTLSSPSGGEIHFTLDGSPPTLSSPQYVEPFELPVGRVVLTAVAFRSGWQPSPPLVADYTIDDDTEAPTITATLSPTPGVGGWNSGDVIVTFHCADAASAITFCTPPTTVHGEGAGIEVAGFARDEVGNAARLKVPVNIDRTPPALTVFAPADEETLAAGTSTISISGGVWDQSGVTALICDTQPATVEGNTFGCTVAVQQGANVITLFAEDGVGHRASHSFAVHVGDGPPPGALRFTPARMTLMAGEVRELLLKDDRDRPVRADAWSSNNVGVVGITSTDGRLMVAAVGSGQTEVAARFGGLTARAVVEVLAADASPSPGTILWALEDQPAPKRASIIPASPTLADDPANTAALFYVDEGSEWFGPELMKPTGVPVTIRATTADGRELWKRAISLETTVKHVAADQNGGLVIVWNQWFDGATAVFHPDAAQRIDGRTGRTSWEYRPDPPAFLGETAMHPDGRVFMTEQRLFGESTLTAIALDGALTHWPLPGGHFTRVDNGTGVLSDEADRPARTTHPIITEDEAVMVVVQRNFVHEVVVSEFIPDGLQVRLDPDASISEAEALVIRLVNDALAVTVVEGRWDGFRPEDYRLLPDGDGGVLLGHRELPHVVRFDSADRLVAAASLTTSTDGYTYGTEYVLGDGAAYVLVHGASDNGQAHWSSSIAFEPLTLARKTSTSLGSQLARPTHLRLQFASAGGGVVLSGPDAPDGAHATPVGGEAWGTWSAGPALVVGEQPAVAETVWPSPGGTSQRANAAYHRGFGVFAKSHTVLTVGRHVSLRIVPRDQEYWVSTYPAAFVNVDDRGRRFATIGAGPGEADTGAACDGSLRLISGVNRTADVYQQPRFLEPLRYARTKENEVIRRLFSFDAAYADNLSYCFLAPMNTDMYNSNSYISGLLKAVGVPRPVTPTIFVIQYPGWIKPVPAHVFTDGQ